MTVFCLGRLLKIYCELYSNPRLLISILAKIGSGKFNLRFTKLPIIDEY
jgi:hypothetical protein